MKDEVRAKVVDEQAQALARKEGEARVAALKDKPTDAVGTKQIFDRRAAQSLPKPLVDAILGADPKKLPQVRGVDLGEQGYVVVRVNAVLPLELPPGSLLSSIRKSRVRVFPTREALLTRTAPSSLK